MKKQDIIGLGMAYLGCFIMTAMFLAFFDRGEVPGRYFKYVMMGCIGIGGMVMIKDSGYWGYAIRKVVRNIKNNVKRLNKL